VFLFPGMLKFCTFGFMFIGHLIDMLLIAIQVSFQNFISNFLKNVYSQVVTPADGSAYVVDFYGARLTRIQNDNETYVLPPDYLWLIVPWCTV
jgi:hypothetical protein